MLYGTVQSWWDRIAHPRNAPQNLVCTFCQRPAADVAKLIAGPDVFICDGCTTRALEHFEAGSPAAAGEPTTFAGQGAKPRCSFCRKASTATRPLAGSADASICKQCAGACRQILLTTAP